MGAAAVAQGGKELSSHGKRRPALSSEKEKRHRRNAGLAEYHGKSRHVKKLEVEVEPEKKVVRTMESLWAKETRQTEC